MDEFTFQEDTLDSSEEFYDKLVDNSKHLRNIIYFAIFCFLVSSGMFFYSLAGQINDNLRLQSAALTPQINVQNFFESNQIATSQITIDNVRTKRRNSVFAVKFDLINLGKESENSYIWATAQFSDPTGQVHQIASHEDVDLNRPYIPPFQTTPTKISHKRSKIFKFNVNNRAPLNNFIVDIYFRHPEQLIPNKQSYFVNLKKKPALGKSVAMIRFQ